MSILKAKTLAARYGIAEWFGKDMLALTPVERQQYGRIAAKQEGVEVPSDAPPCPFLATLTKGARCNKAGGVCSIRKYSPEGIPVKSEKIVTTCPSRFLEHLEHGQSLFSWIAEKMLDIQEATIIKETPFLRKIDDLQRPPEIANAMKVEAKEEEKKAGRIDWIIVNEATVQNGELEWCAIETQALYFSGRNMRTEFRAYAEAPSPVLFPNTVRRPDYRSSGPKRLWPQLDVKVPVLRAWGKKVVVVVDQYFYSNMNQLADSLPRARDDRARRDNAEIVWFIVDYNDQLNLRAVEVIYTSLESSRVALNATEPLSKLDFTRNLKLVLADVKRKNKVFKTLPS